MSNVVVIGTQWGDEGKGKIVDWLSEKANLVVRFQGGHNAGHTLVVEEKIFKLSLLPSGIVRENTIVLIGNGVVIDPFHLKKEINELKNKNIKISPENLIIADSPNTATHDFRTWRRFSPLAAALVQRPSTCWPRKPTTAKRTTDVKPPCSL